MAVKPYDKNSSKKQQVEEMFDGISKKYDFLNHFLSAGIDKKWRKKVRKMIAEGNHKNILDVATGTGDLCVELTKIDGTQLIGFDLSRGMLDIGEEKIKNKGLTDRIKFIHGDGENMPFEDNQFDAVTVAFGVRNFENLEQGLSECYRVLKEGGELIVLEFSNPERFPIKQLFNFYSGTIMPTVGGMFSKDKKAYKYLHDSSRAFPNGINFTNILEKVGFVSPQIKPLSMGIASIYRARK